MTRERDNVPKNTPWVSLASGAIMLAVGLTLILSGNGGRGGGALLLGVVVSNLSGVIGSAFAERTSRDVRNGTVVEKVRQGTHQALEEKQVVTRDGPFANQSIETLARHTEALTHLLEAATAREKGPHDDEEQAGARPVRRRGAGHSHDDGA